jgi:hypothetical protein
LFTPFCLVGRYGAERPRKAGCASIGGRCIDTARTGGAAIHPLIDDSQPVYTYAQSGGVKAACTGPDRIALPRLKFTKRAGFIAGSTAITRVPVARRRCLASLEAHVKEVAMNRYGSSTQWNSVLSATLGVVAVFFATAYLLGMGVPLAVSDRAAFYALAATGFGMCMLSMGRTATGLGWTHPVTIAGIVLGALIVLLVVAVAAGWPVPFIPTDRAAFIVVAVLGLAKWALGLYSRAYLKV